MSSRFHSKFAALNSSEALIANSSAIILGKRDLMDELVKKIDSYNLFNYIVPGVVTSEAIVWLFGIKPDVSIFVSFFVYYFVGLVVSRVGSLVVEPVLLRTKILSFEPYSRYLAAVKKDQKLELMSQENNMYRTYVSMIIIIFVALLYARAQQTNAFVSEHTLVMGIGLAGLTLLMTLAYRKQTDFVTKRIKLSK